MEYNDWNESRLSKPFEGEIVETMISDENGIRNIQPLIYHSNLWWTTDKKMYVYYTPTHWRYIE